MKVTFVLGAAIGAATLLTAAAAQAADDFQPEGKGTFIVDLRVSDVIPDANSAIYTAAGVNTGLRVQVGDSVMPTLGFKYFLTDHFAVEAILGVTDHDINAVAPNGASTKVHNTWVVPPVVSILYHPLPKARISPYVGAGVNAMLYGSGGDYNGFTVKLRDEFGGAVQFGADIAIHGPWLLNVDAKKVFTNTRANIDDGALYSHVGLNPWVASVGVGRKF
jgi:outer membrane protein